MAEGRKLFESTDISKAELICYVDGLWAQRTGQWTECGVWEKRRVKDKLQGLGLMQLKNVDDPDYDGERWEQRLGGGEQVEMKAWILNKPILPCLSGIQMGIQSGTRGREPRLDKESG